MNLNPFDLHRYGAKVHSQFNEDGITLELVSRLNPPQTFIEIGAGHNGENCTHVLLDQGWTGYWVEGNFDHFLGLFKLIDNDRITLKKEFVTAHQARPSMRVAHKKLGRDIGVFSLDIDGNDYWVWKELCTDFFRPAICIVEFNAQKPLDQPFIMPEDPTYQWDHVSYDFGASLYSMIELGDEMGYSFVGTASATPQLDSPNAFFVRDDLIGGLSQGGS